jgi:hypothetical protein
MELAPLTMVLKRTLIFALTERSKETALGSLPLRKERFKKMVLQNK